jgi:hypothetical protein
LLVAGRMQNGYDFFTWVVPALSSWTLEEAL